MPKKTITDIIQHFSKKKKWIEFFALNKRPECHCSDEQLESMELIRN